MSHLQYLGYALRIQSKITFFYSFNLHARDTKKLQEMKVQGFGVRSTVLKTAFFSYEHKEKFKLDTSEITVPCFL